MAILILESHQPVRSLALSSAEESQLLTEILRRRQMPLNTRCGQRHICDGCTIELLGGTLVHAATGQLLSASGEPLAVRACEFRPHPGSEVRLRIPARALLAHQPFVLTDFSIQVPYAQDPIVPAPGLGVAIDIGTTTVVVLLADLATGAILSRAAGFNHQMHLGDDVVTRITLCAQDPGNVRRLQRAVVDQAIAPLLRRCADQADVRLDQVRCMTVAGNTTMLHLFCGVDPSSMGVAPFTPRFLDHRILRVPEIFDCSSLDLVPSTQLHVLPGAAAYIGADLAAGVVASGLLYDEGPSLLVDVGTNGEIILKHGDALLGCATAAGPAFEGAGLSSGVRAATGAISGISIGRDPFTIKTTTIDDAPPIGLCGSAYIDLLAEGRAAGLLTPAGRFDRANLPSGAGNYLIGWNNHDLALRLARIAGTDIVVSQTDIARLLQAKAAVAAGILILLKNAGLAPADVRRLYLAGGFGTHMNGRNAVACGLLPGFTGDQIRAVGNTSLAGAYLALMDSSVLPELARIRQRLQVVELNLDPDFESTYIDQLLLP